MGSRTNSTATGWNGRFDYTYDPSGQLQTAWAYNGSGTQLTSQKWGYAYDPGQNLLRQTNNATSPFSISAASAKVAGEMT